MNPNLRAALPTRFTALGFIVVLLGGNFWVMYLILGQKVPNIIVEGFNLGVLMVIVGGISMLYWKFKNPEVFESNLNDSDPEEGES
jgi:hypothetical protein